MNLHKGHKVIPIEDEESLKKENININDYIKEFDESAKNCINIKIKIENEIKKLNESYEKINKETTNYFELKHKKLINEEKEIKNKLNNEVTKIKSQLEEYFSLVSNLIQNYENIHQGINSLDKNEQTQEINIIKTLTYVSKLNKYKKEMIKISQILMKNLQLNFIEDNIEYKEYYFNGLPIPKEIQINDIKLNDCCISWKVDDLNILNIDKNKLMFNIELRRENDKFNSIYEGIDMNYKIDKLISNSIYEIRICSKYNNIFSNYSEIKKIKTDRFDSLILNETNKCDEFLNQIYEWTGGKNMELLYRGTRDGMSVNAFHNKCNNQGPTINIFKNEKGYVFGGYASKDWQNSGGQISAPESFLFTLTNMFNIPPTRFPISETERHICNLSEYGPTFGRYYDIFIDFNSNYIGFPKSYKDILGKGYLIFTGDNDTRFNLKEIEIFKLIK